MPVCFFRVAVIAALCMPVCLAYRLTAVVFLKGNPKRKSAIRLRARPAFVFGFASALCNSQFSGFLFHAQNLHTVSSYNLVVVAIKCPAICLGAHCHPEKDGCSESRKQTRRFLLWAAFPCQHGYHSIRFFIASSVGNPGSVVLKTICFVPSV